MPKKSTIEKFRERFGYMKMKSGFIDMTEQYETFESFLLEIEREALEKGIKEGERIYQEMIANTISGKVIENGKPKHY